MSDKNLTPNPSPKGEGSQIEAARVALVAVLSVMSAEQFEQVVAGLILAHDNAVIRQCSQSVAFEFNDKGFPRYIHHEQSVEFVKPRSDDGR